MTIVIIYRGLGRTSVIACIPVEEDNIDIGQPLISLPPTLTMSDNDLMITPNNVTTDERKEQGCELCDRQYILIYRYTGYVEMLEYTCTFYMYMYMKEIDIA